MNTLEAGDIVLLKFPYTDGQSYKRRPALLLHNSDDEDIIVCRITSKIYESDFDILIREWEQMGLKLPSVIRVHKIATLEKSLVELVIGKIDSSTRKTVKEKFDLLIN
ncbi:type II toxin-antitoxin system PemK/MazF family toxin [Pontibacter sp. 172403-2]|uniref:type II toxin-antitoxin system PemK/MazF family toxin n=1 Tax=Pontibacter rufus TaxID=2791028 RepID=UPI0018B00CC8|nr:type II toxin-antitoxin system PemK/MazF family toxin [Pontibacter sp. 172403-2]MBF9252639.1 type II toxin-antitoxin system PemK/MazF family toxin [Pontibacter sp. 172403-2]